MGDPIAMTRMGSKILKTGRNFERKFSAEVYDYERAFVYFSRAATLGHIEAHHYLGMMYFGRIGVEKDEAKMVHHLKQAAIGGHPISRYLLAGHEQKKGRMDRAAKHFLIAAKLGHDDALKMVKEYYRLGFVSKEDFAAALRGYQTAIDAAKSDQRTQFEEFHTK